MSASRLPLAAGLAAVLVLGIVGAAVAYWQTSGTGAGSAGSASTQPITLTPAVASAQISPSGTADVVLNVTNPNAGIVHIGSLSLDSSQATGGFAVDAAHAGCGVASLSFTTQTNGGIGWDVPGGATTPLTLFNALAMATTAANACQGARFTVYLKVGS